jgi:hypothetical protein
VEVVTVPGPASGEVIFPSPKFKALGKPQQQELVSGCTRLAMKVIGER